MERRMTQREKTLRAFRVYLDLIDTAEWMKGELRGQLECFDMTFPGFRVMEILLREGPVGMADAARYRGCNRQNLDVVVARLERNGWVRQELVRRRPVRVKRSQLPKRLRGKPRPGRQIAMISLTPAGEKFMENFLPKHAKMVKSFMRALEGRDQEALGRLCRKLREGDVVKFCSEIRRDDIADVTEPRELVER
jgi:MarR family 2-MHQ and catechol resistance regulon transcriptional repressor